MKNSILSNISDNKTFGQVRTLLLTKSPLGTLKIIILSLG